MSSTAKHEDWLAYLKLLQTIGEYLDDLEEIEREKITAINQGDLFTIDEIIKEEQVMAMTLRGIEQKRQKLLEPLDLPPGKLKDLALHLPDSLRSEGKRTIDQVQSKYKRYQTASELARKNLEVGLKQLESITGINTGYQKPVPKKEREPGREPAYTRQSQVPTDLHLRAQHAFNTAPVSEEEQVVEATPVNTRKLPPEHVMNALRREEASKKSGDIEQKMFGLPQMKIKQETLKKEALNCLDDEF